MSVNDFTVIIDDTLDQKGIPILICRGKNAVRVSKSIELYVYQLLDMGFRGIVLLSDYMAVAKEVGGNATPLVAFAAVATRLMHGAMYRQSKEEICVSG